MPQRMPWPDVARGISILGVIVLHVGLTVPNGESTGIYQFNDNLLPLRMPLFFMISGFFALKVMNMSLNDVLAKRIWFLAVPYLLWGPAELWFKSLERAYGTGEGMPDSAFYMDQILNGRSMYWFLHALIAFTIVLWACRFVPVWARYALVVAMILAPGLLSMDWTATHFPLAAGLLNNEALPYVSKYLTYLPIFLLGAFCRPGITKFAEKARNPLTIAAAGVALYAGRTILEWDTEYWDGTIQAIGSLLHLPAAIVASVLLAKLPFIGSGLQIIGRNTLPIYLGHQIGLTALFGFIFAYADFAFEVDATTFLDRPTFWVFYGILACLMGGLFLHHLQKVPYLGWTIKPPALSQLKEVLPNASRHKAQQEPSVSAHAK
ncbi:acyltransferase family protein [Corynebacterium sp. ZY180755]